MLPNALESVLSQKTNGDRYEVIVVDNNSTDGTREVIEAFIARGCGKLRYVLEERQGVSYARNTGIENASAPIIAFFDDDERVRPDWVANIKRAFDEHPEVDFVGGKILPLWSEKPPAWLTAQFHWAPVALTDYGDTPFYSNAQNPVCLISGNLAIKRDVFEHIGLFGMDLQRVKGGIGSIEDHEIQLRFWRVGKQGMYVPNIVIEADVPVVRMSKAYHRKWHTEHGKFSSVMRLNELIGADGTILETPLETVKLFGVPAYLYRELITVGGHWFGATLRWDETRAFMHENRIRHLASYIRTSYRQSSGKKAFVAEVSTFVMAMLRRKVASRVVSVSKRDP